MSHQCSDDNLLGELGRALSVPPDDAVRAAKACYVWRTIDAELAQLSYDSSVEPASSLAVRAEGSAVLRSLTFEADELSIELEISGGTVRGQVVPPGPGRVELRGADGTVTQAEINETGYFTVQATPSERYRLFCAPDDAGAVLTDWIYL